MIATIQTIVSGIPTPGRQRMDADEREREPVDPDAEPGQNAGSGGLSSELSVPRETAEVVDDPDRDRDRGAEQQPAVLVTAGEKGERRHEQPEEEREAAEARHRQLVDAPTAGSVDDAESPSHASHRRRQQDDDDTRDERSEDDGEVVAELIEDAEVRAGRRKHGASVLRHGQVLASASVGSLRVRVEADAARRFLMARHFLAPARSLEGGPDAVLEVIRKLGSIQFDPIALAGRNHDLMLHARVAGYDPAWCDTLYRAPQDLRDDQQGAVVHTCERVPLVSRERGSQGP